MYSCSRVAQKSYSYIAKCADDVAQPQKNSKVLKLHFVTQHAWHMKCTFSSPRHTFVGLRSHNQLITLFLVLKKKETFCYKKYLSCCNIYYLPFLDEMGLDEMTHRFLPVLSVFSKSQRKLNFLFWGKHSTNLLGCTEIKIVYSF